MKLSTILLVFVIALITSLAGAAKNFDSSPCCVINLAIDISKSCSAFPPLSTSNISGIIDVAANLGGGTVGFSLIVDSSFRPMLRETFQLDTLVVEGLTLSNRISALHYNDSIKYYYSQKKQWFIDSALALIRNSTRPNTTDISGYVRRLNLLMDEEQFTQCIRIALIQTESKHNVGPWISPAELPECKKFISGSDETLAAHLFGSQCKCVESLSGAVESIKKANRGNW